MRIFFLPSATSANHRNLQSSSVANISAHAKKSHLSYAITWINLIIIDVACKKYAREISLKSN